MSSGSSSTATSAPPPAPPPSARGRFTSARNQRDYSPVSWAEYFDEAHDILLDSKRGNQTNDNDHDRSVEQDSFRVYIKNFKEPFAPKRTLGGNDLHFDHNEELSEAQMAAHSRVPTLVLLHGGGYSGLTWAQFSKSLTEQHCKSRILAMDLRGHGDTKTTHDDQMDIQTLVADVIAVVRATHSFCGFRETPKLVLIGHSMGGAIAINCAAASGPDSLESLAGFVVIDVVEGTAKDALPLMMSVIKTRPTRFPTLDNAIEWSIRSGMAKNSDAARVSMPGNLVNIATGQLAIHDVVPKFEQDCPEDSQAKQVMLKSIRKHQFHLSLDQLIGASQPAVLLPPRLPLSPRIAALKSADAAPTKLVEPPAPSGGIGFDSTIGEEPESSCEVASLDNELGRKRLIAQDSGELVGYKRPIEVDKTGFSWRTNLAKTQPFWTGWFDGLSAQMLASPVQGKFLLLAGIDRLDKTLTIGHMQGKFMMKVLPKCGHAVHEDVPEQVASVIGDFLVRNKFAEAKTTQD